MFLVKICPKSAILGKSFTKLIQFEYKKTHQFFITRFVSRETSVF